MKAKPIEQVAREWCQQHGWTHACEGDADRRRIDQIADLIRTERKRMSRRASRHRKAWYEAFGGLA